MEIIKNPNFDFLSKAKYFVVLSLLLIVAGAAWILTGHLRYGVEFSGGTQLIVHFQNPPDVDKIRDAVEKVSPGAVIQQYGELKAQKVLVRISQEAPESDLDAPARAVRERLAADYGQNPILESSSEIVGPIVGAELRNKAVWLTVLGLLFQLIYIAARFRGGIWGVGATVAALHDVLIALGFLALFDFEITLNVIAALLTLVGYSVNDTIVIFDRVRENLLHRRKEPLGAHPQRLAQPDPHPYHHLERHHVPLRAGPVPLRRRGVARLRLRDGDRHHRRHLLDAVHRGADRQLVVRPQRRHGAGAGHRSHQGAGQGKSHRLTTCQCSRWAVFTSFDRLSRNPIPAHLVQRKGGIGGC